MAPWILHFDGLCEARNPGGRMAWGWTLNRGEAGTETGKGTRAPAPENTNNVAEYMALGYGLRRVMELAKGDGEGPSPDYPGVLIHGDSKLVIEQINDHWSINATNLKPLHARCLEILKWLQQTKCWGAQWIPREQNTAADALSREAYKDAEGTEPPERQKFHKQ